MACLFVRAETSRPPHSLSFGVHITAKGLKRLSRRRGPYLLLLYPDVKDLGRIIRLLSGVAPQEGRCRLYSAFRLSSRGIFDFFSLFLSTLRIPAFGAPWEPVSSGPTLGPACLFRPSIGQRKRDYRRWTRYVNTFSRLFFRRRRKGCILLMYKELCREDGIVNVTRRRKKCAHDPSETGSGTLERGGRGSRMALRFLYPESITGGRLPSDHVTSM
jgi:hypothetical protein